MSRRERFDDDQQLGMLTKSLGRHRLNADSVLALDAVAAAALAFGTALIINAPSTPERTLALRKIEEATMWANKSIGMNQPEATP